MQAGAMGLSSIVTNINGCNEIIEAGKNGIIIPVKNKDALQKAMETFYHKELEGEKRSTKNREMIMRKYDQTRVWKAILEEYRRLEEEPVH